MNQSCCCCGRRDIVKLLLDHGADLDAATSSINSTPHACKNGDLFTTKLLLDRGCAVNFVDKYGKTALHHACLGRSCTECVKELLLLAHGADTTVKTRMERIHLMWLDIRLALMSSRIMRSAQILFRVYYTSKRTCCFLLQAHVGASVTQDTT